MSLFSKKLFFLSLQARREVLSAKHKQMVDNLFNKWDNDGQGYIDNEEVDEILSK